MKCKVCSLKKFTKKIVGIGFMSTTYELTCEGCGYRRLIKSNPKIRKEHWYGKTKSTGTGNNG